MDLARRVGSSSPEKTPVWTYKFEPVFNLGLFGAVRQSPSPKRAVQKT